MLIQLLRDVGCAYRRRAYIRDCANSTSEGFWVSLQTEILHPKVCLYNFEGVVSRPPYGELTCGSMVIKLLKCFRCSSRRRAYIRDYAYKTLDSFTNLSPGQTIATYQRNMSQHCWAQHDACVWPACCDMLRLVGCCWLRFDHFQT